MAREIIHNVTLVGPHGKPKPIEVNGKDLEAARQRGGGRMPATGNGVGHDGSGRGVVDLTTVMQASRTSRSVPKTGS